MLPINSWDIIFSIKAFLYIFDPNTFPDIVGYVITPSPRNAHVCVEASARCVYRSCPARVWSITEDNTANSRLFVIN